MVTDKIINDSEAQARKLGNRIGLDPSTIEDMVQEALIAVVEASDRYTGESDAAFSTYSYAAVAGQLRKWLAARQYSVIPIPRRTGEGIARVEAVKARLSQELGREPRNREVAEELDMSLDEYEHIRAAQAFEPEQDSSTNSDHMLDPDYISFEDTLSDDTDYEELISELEMQECIDEAVGSLTDQEQIALGLLFGHDSALREVADHLGTSHEQVRRVKEKALNKLRARMPDEV